MKESKRTALILQRLLNINTFESTGKALNYKRKKKKS